MKATITGIMILCILFFASCAGSRATLKFAELKYPVSMSSSLYGRNGRVVTLENGLAKNSDFVVKTTFWSIGWSFIPLSSGSTIDHLINEQIQSHKGAGAINVEFQNDTCRMNTIPVLAALPIWPNCMEITIKGTIVNERGSAI